MIVLSRMLLIFSLGALLPACASHAMISTKSTANLPPLANTTLYAYELLDLREVEFGPSMLNALDRQLQAALATHGIAVKILRFKDTQQGQYHAGLDRGNMDGGTLVPVKEIIERNMAEEQAQGTEYRLVVFPSSMILQGAWKFYDIRWEVFSVKHGRPVWRSTYQGKHPTMWSNDENPEGRAKIIVDAVIEEMTRSGLLRGE